MKQIKLTIEIRSSNDILLLKADLIINKANTNNNKNYNKENYDGSDLYVYITKENAFKFMNKYFPKCELSEIQGNWEGYQTDLFSDPGNSYPGISGYISLGNWEFFSVTDMADLGFYRPLEPNEYILQLNFN